MKLVLTKRDNEKDVVEMTSSLAEYVCELHKGLADATALFADDLVSEGVTEPHAITEMIIANTAAANIGIPLSELVCITTSAKEPRDYLDVISLNESYIADKFNTTLLVEFTKVLDLIYFSRLVCTLNGTVSKAFGTNLKALPGVKIASYVNDKLLKLNSGECIYKRIKAVKETEDKSKLDLTVLGEPTNEDLQQLVKELSFIQVC